MLKTIFRIDFIFIYFVFLVVLFAFDVVSVTIAWMWAIEMKRIMTYVITFVEETNRRAMKSQVFKFVVWFEQRHWNNRDHGGERLYV